MRRDVPEPAPLDLVPIMNLVTILIPFLLMSTSFVTLAVVDTTMPEIVVDPQPRTEPDRSPPTLRIDRQGYRVADVDEVLGDAHVACLAPGCPAADAWDHEGLRRLMVQLKARLPEEERIVIVPDGTVPYEVMIHAMDAVRADGEGSGQRDLFPLATIAAGL